MTLRITRLPDVGEGVAEAELVAWHVHVGDTVTSDTVVAEVLTDKATVEIYAPVAGTVHALHGEPGDVLAVGSDFIEIEFEIDTEIDTEIETEIDIETDTDTETETEAGVEAPDPAPVAMRPQAAPAVRAEARTRDIDLARVAGSGPDGRITHADLAGRTTATPTSATVRTTPVIGVRRAIAARMTIAARIPHITYVDEVDMTSLEHLRATLVTTYPDRMRLTVLPFLVRSIVIAVGEQPHLNATFDDEAQQLTTSADVHVGIATQTPNGLLVPVVRDAHALDLWQTAASLSNVTSAAREGTAKRDELSGSTITITSLGALGGLVTTPILNHPEVAIVGVNKMQIRPVWDGTTFVPRTMMNLSSSFDHRIVDGWDAATFVQRIRVLLEEPALLFLPADPAAQSSSSSIGSSS